MLLAAVVIPLLWHASAQADTYYWTGYSPDYNNWSDTRNWNNNAAPGYGTLDFNGSYRQTNYDDAITLENIVTWEGSSAWTLNALNGTILTLKDFSGSQAKIENRSSGLVTINLPMTFGATSGAAWGEVNAINGDLTFGTGALTVNGSVVNGIRMYGTGHTVTFNNTVNAAGRYFAMTAANDTVAVGGGFTAGNVYVMNGGTLNLTGTGGFNADVRLGGDFGTTGAQNLASAATLNFTNAAGGLTYSTIINTVAGNTSGGLAVNSQNTGGTNTITGGGIFADSSFTLSQAAGGTLALSASTVDVKSNTLTINAAGNVNVTSTIISSTGSGGIVKTGAGTLTLGGANTYTGGTTINAGAVSIVDGGTLGNGSSVSVASGATLNFANAGAMTVSNPISSAVAGAGTITASGSGTLTLSGGTSATPNTIAAFAQTNGTVNLGGFLNIGNAQVAGNKLSVNGGGTLNVTGTTVDAVKSVNIGETSAGTLNVNGGNVSIVTGTAGGNAFYVGGSATGASGTVSVNGGTLAVNGLMYVGAGTNGTNGAAPGTLNLNGGLFTTGTVSSSSTNALIVGGSAFAGGTVNLNTGGTLATALTVTGSGTGGASTFNFNGGTVQATADVALLSGLTAVNVQAGGVVIDPKGFKVGIGQSMSHVGSGIDGGLTLTGDGGSVTLSADNTFTGPTNIGANLTLNVSSPNALKYSTLNYNGGGSVHFMTAPIALGGLSGSQALALSGTSSAAFVLSVGYNNADTAYGGVLSAAGGLTKAGTGTLALGGANTYAGNTTVSGGTLAVNGSITDPTPRDVGYVPGAVTVASGGALAGTGQINETVAVSGKISAGSGAASGQTAGRLNTLGQTWNRGGTYVVKFARSGGAGSTAAVAGTDFDTLNLTGLLNLASLSAANPFNIVLTKAAGGTFVTPSAGTQYKIAYASQKISPDTMLNDAYAPGTNLSNLFTLNTDDLGLAPAAFSVVVGADGSGADLLLQFNGGSATPEPGTVALCGVGGAAVLGRRRRMRGSRRGALTLFRL